MNIDNLLKISQIFGLIFACLVAYYILIYKPNFDAQVEKNAFHKCYDLAVNKDYGGNADYARLFFEICVKKNSY